MLSIFSQLNTVSPKVKATPKQAREMLELLGMDGFLRVLQMQSSPKAKDEKKISTTLVPGDCDSFAVAILS